MAHNCKRTQHGQDVCAEHILTRQGLNYRFRKQMQAAFDMSELTAFYETMRASMLPADTGTPLDDRPQWYIDQVAKGWVPN